MRQNQPSGVFVSLPGWLHAHAPVLVSGVVVGWLPSATHIKPFFRNRRRDGADCDAGPLRAQETTAAPCMGAAASAACGTTSEPLRRKCGTAAEPLRGKRETAAEPLRNRCGTAAEPLRNRCGGSEEPLRISCGLRCGMDENPTLFYMYFYFLKF